MIRVALCSGRRIFRDSLAAYIDARPDCTVVGSVPRLEDLAMVCALRQPGLLVVDIGAELDEPAMTRLREHARSASLVVIYDRLTAAELTALRRLGVDSLLPRSHGLDALMAVLRRQTPGPPRPVPAPRRQSWDGLRDRDMKILSLVGAGHTADQIAGLLAISTSAVASARRRIYRSLEVSSRSQAVARATALGIVSWPPTRKGGKVRARGPVVTVLRGPAGPARERVAAALLGGGIPVAFEANGSQPLPTDVERPQSRVVVLVDPAPQDWPAGRDAGLPIALVTSAPPRQSEVVAALLRGAVAIVTVDRTSAGLVPAVTLAGHGYLAVDAGAAEVVLAAFSAPPVATPPELTPREQDILRSIANGDTVRLTARTLGIAEKTVENTQARLFRKLGVHNRPGALAAAHAMGLLPQPASGTAGPSRSSASTIR